MEKLQNAAGAIVDLVYSISPTCCFVESSGRDWILQPEKWIALHFTYGRSATRLHISLNMWPGNLEPQKGLKVKQGRIACWSKITVEAITDLPPTLNYILQLH